MVIIDRVRAGNDIPLKSYYAPAFRLGSQSPLSSANHLVCNSIPKVAEGVCNWSTSAILSAVGRALSSAFTVR